MWCSRQGTTSRWGGRGGKRPAPPPPGSDVRRPARTPCCPWGPADWSSRAPPPGTGCSSRRVGTRPRPRRCSRRSPRCRSWWSLAARRQMALYTWSLCGHRSNQPAIAIGQFFPPLPLDCSHLTIRLIAAPTAARSGSATLGVVVRAVGVASAALRNSNRCWFC